VYRLAVKPTTGSSVTPQVMLFPGSAYPPALFGADLVYSQRTDAGAWSDDASKRLIAGLVIDGMDFGGAPAAVTKAFSFVG
jgi:hypothetical protein